MGAPHEAAAPRYPENKKQVPLGCQPQEEAVLVGWVEKSCTVLELVGLVNLLTVTVVMKGTCRVCVPATTV